MPESKSSHPVRVLVIRAGQLGDTVCAASIIEPLRSHFGETTIIDWVAKAGIGNLFARDPRINRIFHIRSRRTPVIFNAAKLQIIFYAIFNPYDYVINLELGTIFNGVVRLTRAKNKIGMPYKHFSEPAETHAVENLHLIYQSFLDAKDLLVAQPSLIGTNISELKSKFDLPDHYIVLVPSNSHHNKKSGINLRGWPAEHWKELFNLLQKNNLSAVMVGAESERSYFNKLDPVPDNIVSLVGKTNFPELVGIIKNASAVVVTDTGPAHIAAAVDTPVYALIGPTNYKRTGPYQTKTNKITVISSNQACSPCYHTKLMLTCRDNKCMTEISPAMVIAQLKGLHS